MSVSRCPIRHRLAHSCASARTTEFTMLSRSPVVVTLPVRELAAAQQFYSKQLGLKRLHGSVKEGYLEYGAGQGTRLQVFESTLTSQARKSNDTAATFEVQNLTREMAARRKKGVVFEDYDLPNIKTVD